MIDWPPEGQSSQGSFAEPYTVQGSEELTTNSGQQHQPPGSTPVLFRLLIASRLDATVARAAAPPPATNPDWGALIRRQRGRVCGKVSSNPAQRRVLSPSVETLTLRPECLEPADSKSHARAWRRPARVCVVRRLTFGAFAASRLAVSAEESVIGPADWQVGEAVAGQPVRAVLGRRRPRVPRGVLTDPALCRGDENSGPFWPHERP